jgi:hypothetical protein
MQSASNDPRPRLKFTDQAQCTSPVMLDAISPYISGPRPSEESPKLDGRAMIFLRASSVRWWYTERSRIERMTRRRALAGDEARTRQ